MCGDNNSNRIIKWIKSMSNALCTKFALLIIFVQWNIAGDCNITNIQ